MSIIVPLFNQRRFVTDALESIFNQQHRPLQVIVVNDGSTDRPQRALDRFQGRIEYLEQPNQGPASARNSGLRLAEGEWLAFLDADDLWPEDKLENQLACLAEEPEADLVLSRIRLLRADPEGTGFRLFGKAGFGVQLGSVIFRRRAFDKVGLFDEALRFSEDHDWFFRAREKRLHIVHTDAVGLYHRKYDQSMTARAVAAEFALPQVIKASLDRRREESDSDAAALEPIARAPQGAKKERS